MDPSGVFGDLGTLLWLVGGVFLVVLLVCAFLALFAKRFLLSYVDFVLECPKWLVVVCFVLFPPAFIAFLAGLVFWSMREAKAENDLVKGVTEIYWQQNPPTDQIQGDEKTRRAVASARRKLGYDD